MIRIVAITIFVLLSTSLAWADSGTFGNPYPRKSTVPQYGGPIYMLPPATVERPRVTNRIDYYYYDNVAPAVGSGGFSFSNRNVLTGSRGPSRNMNIRGGLSPRSISRGTQLVLPRFGQRRRRGIIY